MLDQAHRKRNLAECEGDLAINAESLAALIRVANEGRNVSQHSGRRRAVQSWIQHVEVPISTARVERRNIFQWVS